MESESLNRMVDRVGMTAWVKIRERWQQRFGSELKSNAELVAWLCNEFNLEMTDAQNSDPEDIAELLSMDASALAERMLTGAERDILFSLNEGDVLGSKEIASRAGRDADTVRDCLR